MNDYPRIQLRTETPHRSRRYVIEAVPQPDGWRVVLRTPGGDVLHVRDATALDLADTMMVTLIDAGYRLLPDVGIKPSIDPGLADVMADDVAALRTALEAS